MDLRIATNPHLKEEEAKKLLTELLNRRREIWGPDERSDKFDKQAFDLLRQQLKNSSKSIKVK